MFDDFSKSLVKQINFNFSIDYTLIPIHRFTARVVDNLSGVVK